jgi:hypothetical protein
MIRLSLLLALVGFAANAHACELCRAVGLPSDHSHTIAVSGDAHDHGLAAGDGGTFAPTSTSGVNGGQAASLQTITYSYNNMFDGSLKGPDGVPLPEVLIRGSIEEALGVWAAHIPVNFVEVEDEGGPVVMGNYPNGQYGDIRFHHKYINGPDIPGQQPMAKAQAYFPNLGNHSRDVYYDNGDPWQEFGELAIPDILGATIHELGHTLGLGHSNNPDANMYWIFTRYPGLGTGRLHEEDITRVQGVFGTGVGSVMPLQRVPEPASYVLLALVALIAAGGSRGRRR